MSAVTKRLIIWTGVAIALLAGLVLAFRPTPVNVEIVVVQEAPMTVTIEEEGITRIHDVYVLSAPVAGNVQRIDLHVGDPVLARETVLANIEPGDPSLMDPRTEAQAQAAVSAAQSSYELSMAEVERVSAELEFAESELFRARKLIVDNTISRRALDEATRVFKTTRASLDTARANAQTHLFRLEQARAQLVSPIDTQQEHDSCECIPITAPVSGRILTLQNRSERMVASGETLMEIGDPKNLEIVVDFLSADAVRMQVGQKVIIDRWGGDGPLDGHVRQIEPFGFTKVSALGIEEQRVNVIIDFDSPLEQRSQLGHGFQVDTRVVLWEADSVLTVPLTALFRTGPKWSVFVDVQGVARMKTIEPGKSNGLVTQVLHGLTTGDRVVDHPSNLIEDGVRISE